MRTFNSFDQKTFEQLAKLKQHQLKRVVSTFLRKHYKEVKETKEFIFAEGDIPIALCAHLDTVFKEPPEEIYFDQKKNVMWSCDGLGADDRAGVFAILQIIRSGLKPCVIFTTDEEIGGVGALALSELDCPFKNLKYIIELDRRGAQDAVFYDCDNPEFTDYIESFGFTWNFGSFSDISYICPEWGVAGVNLSVGYRDEHSALEVLFVGQLMSTIEKVKKMLTAKDIPAFKYIPNANYGYGYYDFGTKWYGNDLLKCNYCGKYFLETEMFPAIMQNKTTKHYCPDCVSGNLAWCDICDSAFEKYSPEAPDNGICPLCEEMKERGKLDNAKFNPKAI